jgi:hypothetical protein
MKHLLDICEEQRRDDAGVVDKHCAERPNFVGIAMALGEERNGILHSIHIFQRYARYSHRDER